MKEKSNVSIQEEPKMSNKKEQLGHMLGVLGHDSTYSLWSTWMTPFMTDVLHLPAAFMGVLLAVARVFDGVNDVAMGFIADKTKSKLGRYRSWILRAGPLFCLCVLLSFLIPGENMAIRMVYAAIMYVLVDVIFTAVDIPFWSLPAAMTSNTTERSGILGTTQMASNAVSAGVGIILPLMLAKFGGGSSGSAYLKAALPIVIFGIVMYLLCFGLVREHIVPAEKEKFNFRLALKNIYKNKPLICIQISNALILLALIIRGNFTYYFFTYNIGKMELMSVKSTIGIIAGLLGSSAFIFLSKKMRKKNIMLLLAGIYAAACSVIFMTGWSNVYIIFCCDGIASLCSSGMMVGVNAMMADTMEYGEWMTGQRNEGVITSTRCFVTKCASALGGIAVAAVIGLTGYTGEGVQSAATLSGFHFMMSMACAIIMILAIVPLFFHDLTEEKHSKIVAELAERKAKDN